ncbi:hypothetical protein D3C72_737900 [compost metagenome]
MTKIGTEKPSTENAITARSARVPRRQAANTPSGTAISVDSRMVDSARASDGPTRLLIIAVTGVPECSDTPRSPCSTCPLHKKNWVASDRSSPMCSRICASCVSVAASPASISAGSPGVSRSRQNTSTATVSTTGTVARMRLSR